MQEHRKTLQLVTKNLAHLEINDRDLVKIVTIGKTIAHKGPRTLLIKMENALSKNLILKLAVKMREYEKLKYSLVSTIQIKFW